MTCCSGVAPWVSVRLLLAEYMRKLPYNWSRTREAELMLRLCSSCEQWGCVDGGNFQIVFCFQWDHQVFHFQVQRLNVKVIIVVNRLQHEKVYKAQLTVYEECQGRPNTMSILGECNGLFLWRWRCVSVMICNIWYKLLTTDGRQWDLYPFSGRQNSPLADNFLPTYGTNASPPDKPLNVNFSFLALSLPGMLPWGSSCRNSVYLAA